MRGVILLLTAHPHPRQSIAGRILLDAVRDLPQLVIQPLYDLYPDFSIDVVTERRRLDAAKLVVWHHPLYWYGVPALLKLWFESVLARGWAYGEGGTALRGKDCLWVTTTGAMSEAYSQSGVHGHPFEAFVPAVRQTAVFCGMNWLEPVVVHGAREIGRERLAAQALQFRGRLEDYLRRHG
jgi:glutathione-regulated potassium-efflux system ancillary protein KefF